MRLGPVELRVTDAGRAARSWEQVIGLSPMGETDGALSFGSDGKPLIVLRETASRPAAPGHSGLYHPAVHYPDRFEFGRVLARLAAARCAFSPVDHLFSKAFYVQDPDGISVELTMETPWRMREMHADTEHGLYAIDQDGRARRPSEPLDLEPLLDGVRGSDVAGPAEGAYIGHVHLSVPDLPEAIAFYRDQIGLLEHVAEPAVGIADFSAGGAFTHRLALNTFYGTGVRPAPPEMAAMDRFTIAYDSEERLEETKARLERSGTAVEVGEDGAAVIHDTAGNEVDLVA